MLLPVLMFDAHCREHGAYLLDLVEEVESLHNGNHGYMGSPQSPGSVHGTMAAYSNGYQEKEMADYEEESRVLEEVFFVK